MPLMDGLIHMDMSKFISVKKFLYELLVTAAFNENLLGSISHSLVQLNDFSNAPTRSRH